MAEIEQRTFQDTVNEYLIRHRSILDVQSLRHLMQSHLDGTLCDRCRT